MHDRFTCPLAKCTVELIPMMESKVVPNEWLSTILVYPLQNLLLLANDLEGRQFILRPYIPQRSQVLERER